MSSRARLSRACSVVWLVASFLPLPLDAQWVKFLDETATRLEAEAEYSTGDEEEKAFAWGDVDQDGDTDLVCVRKEPFTSSGRRVNLLFLNEDTGDGWSTDGVLVDRTADYASAADVAGDEGFLTPTNDRDVVLADLDGDGWLDIVTAVTNAATSDEPEKHISHPRIYINLGEDLDGAWLGFEYQADRFPQIYVGTDPEDPCFCSVAAGDLDADGDVDLYFGEYDSQCSPLVDVDDRLFLNDGDGYFTDATTDSFSGEVAIGAGFPFYQSAFGTAAIILDLNDDGTSDILKNTALNVPQYVGAAYGSTVDPGKFDEDVGGYQVIDTMAPYFVSAGDLNDDGLLDIVVTDDAQDHFVLNLGNDSEGRPEWETHYFSYTGGGFDDGRGGNSVIVDLDNDGNDDVVIADVDINTPGCTRRMHIFRNLGDAPGVTLQEQGGAQDWTASGVHDIAVFDLNQDGWLDMVIGTCMGTEVWINDPPEGLSFAYPDGLPAYLAPESEYSFRIAVAGIPPAEPEPGTARFYHSVGGAPFTELPLSEIEENLYEAVLPALACASKLEFYVTAETSDGSLASDPAGSDRGLYYSAVAATGTVDSFVTQFDEAPVDWETTIEPSTAGGEWEWTGAPVGTYDRLYDVQLAPSDDAEQSAGGGLMLTENGLAGATNSANDVDGTATLVTPSFDLEGTDGTVSFSWWFSSTRGEPDGMSVEVSNNAGDSWITVATTAGTGGWESYSFVVGDFVTPSASIRLRFVAADVPNDSITEAGIDNFEVSVLTCDGGEPEPYFVRGDVNADGTYAISDPISLLDTLFQNGDPLSCDEAADANDDGAIDIADAVKILNHLFGGSGPIAAPFPSCGADPSRDGLGCTSFEPCP